LGTKVNEEERGEIQRTVKRVDALAARGPTMKKERKSEWRRQEDYMVKETA
jgi:hypothetical protein